MCCRSVCELAKCAFLSRKNDEQALTVFIEKDVLPIIIGSIGGKAQKAQTLATFFLRFLRAFFCAFCA
jgi:hypothetical protein